MEYEKLFCCPECKAELEKNHNNDAFYCPNCQKEFPIDDEITDFYPEYTSGKVRNQKWMESEKIVAIYESEKWRAKPSLVKSTGISLQDEINLVMKITDPAPDSTILDLSCGTGLYTRVFAGKSPKGRLIGYDLSRPMLRWAVEKIKTEKITNIRFIHGDAHRLPFKDRTFDIVNCTGALHNYTDVKKVLREIARVIKPKGILSIATGLRKPGLRDTLYAWFIRTYFKTHMFTQEELKSLLAGAGFNPIIYHAQHVWMIAGAVKL